MANNIIEKVPPQALDAEMALIGAMLIEKEAITKVMEIITEDDFYKEVNRQIFLAAKDLYLENQPVDLITLSDKLKKNGMFAEAGGSFYLKSLIDSVQTSANVEHYAYIIRDKSILRQLINTGSNIVTEAFNEKYPPNEILDKSQANLFKISQNKNSDFSKVSDLVRPTLKNLEKLHSNQNDISGLPTGFKDIDKMTAGLQPSELIIIAARPSMGKTSFALNIAENVALKEKKPVAIFSLEMSKNLLMTRFLASRARVNAHKLRTGKFNSGADWSKLTSAAQEISESPIYIDDSSDISVIELRARARRLATELEAKGTPLSLVLIDYIQIMKGSSRNSESRQQEIAEISRSLKGLARDLNIPVIALSQLSRKTEDRGRKDNKPQLSDLRESGAIEQDADVVAFIYREGYYNKTDPDVKNSATIIIGKQRNGPVGDVELTFESEFTKFSDSAKRNDYLDEQEI